MKLTIKRSGTFEANWLTGDNVCGHGKPGPQEYKYSCEIVSKSDQLDEYGFIVDQLDVDRVFQEKYYPEEYRPRSCERMAMELVNSIAMMATKISVYRIVVSVGPVPPKGYKGDASISAEWAAWHEND